LSDFWTVKHVGADNWFPGKVKARLRGDRTYLVEFADGTSDEVARDSVRSLARENAKAGGGVLFLDEAYDLNPANNATGRKILAEIMSVAEDYRDKVF